MSDLSVNIRSQDIEVLLSPKDYYQRLLSLIAEAKTRIYITALYLENDAAGQQVLTALYQAKQNNPELDVCIFVDAHRAQRGLIGQEKSLGNRAMYQQFAQQYNYAIDIYGIAVKTKELLGVLHLKGMVFDDQLLYSGASINNVYLQQREKYRLDRYYQLNSATLANSVVAYLQRTFVESGVAIDLTTTELLNAKQQKILSRQTTSIVKRANYRVNHIDQAGELTVTPLVGCGKRNNPLNQTICQKIKESQQEIIIFTPYFNLPRIVIKHLVAALKRGVRVTLVVGDKSASDFFIKPGDNYSFIGVIPYIYEQILRRFVKRWRRYINNGQLNIKLWCDGDNSYHAKGMVIDQRWHLITGSNLNPRAWALDLENGLLIDDCQQSLQQRFNNEYQRITQNTRSLSDYRQLEAINDYPIQPKKLLRRLSLAKIDRVLKRLL
ncbi:CDP-diacylglycerol--serine O-phosphatidyltransferase [Thalassotalea insulae]|uniref:CDP-diacylglycerol--serine O-phosphatidyltransferase n=1 Tax=Thalassotalea insulae TaxID=2056778 RepID=A0ABQ6GPT8_9GAMM|nr:CDP-diacylglycerol--serine O-phosphatidyltransferase [Thalassotalea insulae]GLX78003.1 CDP-diacylglycerol--serine O-phosphatidyltransferase [Thalassotalea insulae]